MKTAAPDTRYNLTLALQFLRAALRNARRECPEATEEILDAIEDAEAAEVWLEALTRETPEARALARIAPGIEQCSDPDGDEEDAKGL